MNLHRCDQSCPFGFLKNTIFVIIFGLGTLNGKTWASFMPICPQNLIFPPASPSYCQCAEGSIRSGPTVTIICDFSEEKDVVLSSALYNFYQNRLTQVAIQIKNATSVHVTQDFLAAVLNSPSVSLDFWRCGTLYLDSSPEMKDRRFNPAFSTFLGIGIINCTIPFIPSKMFRDRISAGLLIRESQVGTIRENTLFNIDKIKYFIIENSTLDKMEGSLSNKDALSMDPGDDNVKWHGLRLSNVTIGTLLESSFNFVNDVSGANAKECDVKVMNCRIGDVKPGAISMTGKIDVTIRGNTFQRMRSDALMVNVTGDLKFEENLVLLLEPGGLKSLVCGENTLMEKITIHLNSLHEAPYNTSNTPFDESCGSPQVFMMISPPQPRTETRTSNATWVLLTLLLLFIGAVAFMGVFFYRNQSFLRKYKRGGVPIGIRDCTTMQELQNSDELRDAEDGNLDTGLSNPIYDIREPS